MFVILDTSQSKISAIENFNSINPLYFIIGKADGHI